MHWGGGCRNPGQPGSPGWGSFRGQHLAGRWALLSGGRPTPPLSQLPIASPVLAAALSAIRNKALRGFPASPVV